MHQSNKHQFTRFPFFFRKWLFADCRNLTSITIPDSISNFNWNIFLNCDKLTSIILPKSITRIDSYEPDLEYEESYPNTTVYYDGTQADWNRINHTGNTPPTFTIVFKENPDPEVKPDPKPDPEVKPDPKPDPEVKPEVKPDPVPDPKPEVKPDPVPDPKPEVKPDPVPDPKPEVKPDPKPVPKPTISLNKTRMYLYTTGSLHSYTLQLRYGNRRISPSQIRWKSSKPSVVSVTKSGKLTGKKKGSAVITATYKGRRYNCRIAVKKPSFKLAKAKLTLRKGRRTQIRYKASPNAKVTYKSLNKKVAVVSSKGIVTAKKKGTVKIRMTCNNIRRCITIKVK